MAHTTGTRVGVPAYHPGVILVNYLGTTIDTALCSSSPFFLSVLPLCCFFCCSYCTLPLTRTFCNHHTTTATTTTTTTTTADSPGYPGTMGQFMDYMIVDKLSVPPDTLSEEISEFVSRTSRIVFQCFVFNALFQCILNAFSNSYPMLVQCFLRIHTHWKTFSPPPCHCR